MHKQSSFFFSTNRRNAILRKCVYLWVRAPYKNS